MTAPFGSYVNHNHFAGLVGMGAVLAAGVAVAYAWRGGEMPPALLASGAAALGLTAAHFASRSRGGLVALLAGLADAGRVCGSAATAARGGRLRRAVPVIAIAALAVAAFGWLAIPAPSRAAPGHGVRGTGGRLGLVPRGRRRGDAARVRGSPAARLRDGRLRGRRARLQARTRRRARARTRRATPSSCSPRAGSPALLLVGWLAAGILLGLRDRVTASRDRFRNALALAAAGGAATLLAHSLVDFNLRLPANALVFAALAGLAAAPRTDPQRLGRSPPRPGRRARAAPSSPLGCAWRAAGAVAAERALARARSARRASPGWIARSPRTRTRRTCSARARRPGATWPTARAAGTTTRLARAEADLRRALALRPRWAEARADLGWVRAFRGDAAGARAEMEAAARLDPTHLDVVLARRRAAGAPGGRGGRDRSPADPEGRSSRLVGRPGAGHGLALDRRSGEARPAGPP